MTMSKLGEDDGRDKYEPIKRLSKVQIQPARNPSKPFTSFCIKDILGTANQHPDTHPPLHHRYNFHNHISNHHPQHHKPHSPSDKYSNDCAKLLDVTSCHVIQKKNSGNSKDSQRDLLNLCRLQQARDSLRSAVLLTASHRSAVLNGRRAVPPPLPEGDHLQTTPVNMSTKIVRPWDNDLDTYSSQINALSAAPGAILTSSTPMVGAILTASEASSEDDEEITVDDDELPAKVVSSGANMKTKSVSPLDALMAMTSKTFEGLEGGGTADPRRREQATLFGKHQPPKKRRKSRTAFTNQQIYELEKRFLYQKYLTPADRDEIAVTLGLTNAQVITWFQNRRAKLKRDLEELKNDVTAAKKLPLAKFVPESLAEMDIRKVQEKTLRDSFNNGGLHSPSSMTSLGEDGHDPSVTPSQSPGEGGLRGEETGSEAGERKHEQAMDTEVFDDENHSSLDGEWDSRLTADEKRRIQSYSPQDNVPNRQDLHSHDFNGGDQLRASGLGDKPIKSEHDGTI